MTLKDATPEICRALAHSLPDGVVAEPTHAYLEEPRGRYMGKAGALVRPRTTEQVARTVRFAAEHGIGIVPYAGGTGLVGGQIAEAGPLPILLSVERLSSIRHVNRIDNVMVAEAGVILADARAAAQDADRLFPLSIAAQGSARIGGNLATNAGGIQVLRYGNARDLCLGIEAVLADGSVLHGLSPLRKDNTGYDLRHLLIGSEGTLGIITAASLRLYPQPSSVATGFVPVRSPSVALELLGLCQHAVGETLGAFELVHGQGLRFLDETMPEIPQPFADRPEWSVLIEVACGDQANASDALEAALSQGLEAGLIEDALVAQSQGQADAFWTVRETIPLANRRVGAVSSHDISVPMSAIADFIDAGFEAIAEINPDLRLNCFGHLGDGNLHYNVFPPKGRDKKRYDSIRPKIKRTLHDLVHQMGGSVSAEHGVGRLKTEDLERYSDPAKLAAMRAIKAALDPKGILNPGAVLREV